PLFDPHGKLIGALDASCASHVDTAPIMEPLVIAGRAVENRMVFELEHATFIRLHQRSDMVGTPLEGILAFSHDGRLLGMNPTARRLLSIDGDGNSLLAFDALFDMPFHRAIDKLRASHQAPVLLDSLNGLRLHARIGSGKGIDQDSLRSAHTVPAIQPQQEARKAVPRDVVALDPTIDKVLEKAHRAFARDIPVLINGETGTGKEVVARLLHANGPRGKGPFVAINCSSLPASLIESELFGYVEGAFTGGRRGGAIGKLEQANGGTLFLDEIGDMPAELQGRLLRVLQERSFTRLGGANLVSIDISVLCATHRDLHKLVANESFREDLYYRINGLRVALPPLRERHDIKNLILHFLFQATAGRAPLFVADAAMHALLRYSWPGNIRQLSHVIRLAAALAEDDGCISLCHLPQEIVDQRSDDANGNALQPAVQAGRQSLAPLERTEYDAIRAALLANNGNISATARNVGISRQTLYRKLKQFGLEELT
ncbi:MAG: sigma-54-dependent Fis family transcriptional regulator, partial [Noviherbaspirillum sp.]